MGQLLVLLVILLFSAPAASPARANGACDAVNDPGVYAPGNYAFEGIIYFSDAARPTRFVAEVKQSRSLDETVQGSFRLTDGRLPEHEKTLRAYYDAVSGPSGFSAERMAWITRVEKDLPLERVRMIRVYDPWTDQTLGTLRIFDGSRRILDLRRRIYVDSAGSDIPYVRQTGSKVVQEIVALFPDIQWQEIGKGFRDHSVAGEVAKSYWEVSNAYFMLRINGVRGDIAFIHTEKTRARLYAIAYGARVVERVHYENGTAILTRQSKILPTDPPESEYLLVVHGLTWGRKVADSFKTDPVKKTLIERASRMRLEWEGLRKRIEEATEAEILQEKRLQAWIDRLP